MLFATVSNASATFMRDYFTSSFEIYLIDFIEYFCSRQYSWTKLAFANVGQRLIPVSKNYGNVKRTDEVYYGTDFGVP